MSEMIDVVVDEDRIKVYNVCRQQLGGIWSDVPQSQLIIKRFSKGYVNKLFYCELPDHFKQKYSDHYKSVVVKISIIFEENNEFFDPLVSMLNTFVLSEKKIAPKVIKIFSGGIISEFIDSRSFNKSDDQNYAMVSLLAQKLAKFHSIKMPIPKDNSKTWLKAVCGDWFDDNMKQSLTNGKLFEAIRSQNMDTFMNLDFGAELLWIKKAILASNSPIVFTHGDFNRENILIRENSNNNNPEIFLIDFDLSSFNYRGIDIGRYFSSWGHEDPLFGFGEYPTDEQMSVFVCAYINENIKLFGNSYSKLEINSKENIIKEAKLFTLMCYLIDVLFCVYTSATDESKLIEFLAKGETRFGGYSVLKKKFQDENSLPFGFN